MKKQSEIIPPSDVFYSMSDVARILSVNRSTVQRMVAKGDIPTVSLGPRMKRVPGEWLEAFIQKLKAQ